LQIALGPSTKKGVAYAVKRYGTSYAKHAAEVYVYLPSGFKLSQSITLLGTQNSTNTFNGSFTVILAANTSLQVSWYSSTGKKLVHTTSSKLASGQWYKVELDQTNSTTSGSWSLYLNGTQIASRVATDTGSLAVDTFLAGDIISTYAPTQNFFYEDDVETAATHIG
jgi:hypothetical protein